MEAFGPLRRPVILFSLLLAIHCIYSQQNANQNYADVEAEVITEISQNDENVPNIVNDQEESSGERIAILNADQADNNEYSTTIISDPTTTYECSSIGDVPHDSDCHLYYTCLMDGDKLKSIQKSCAANEAFNVQYSRCMRDLANCNDDIVCETATTFPDPQSNASYYWCVARIDGGGFHKYHVKCRLGEIFMEPLEKCYIDLDNLQIFITAGKPPIDELSDEDIIKAELKLFKTQEKARLKEEKLKLKLEKKLQKELAKKSAKDAKNKAKLNEIDNDVMCSDGVVTNAAGTPCGM